MKKLIFFLLFSAAMCISQIGLSQTLTVTNNTSQAWNIDYYGVTVNVPAISGPTNVDISGADCHLNVSVDNNGGGCSQTISLGTTDMSTCSSGVTNKCDWSVSGIGNDPCGTTIMNASITFN